MEKIAMTTSTHSHHGYRLIVHHESYDRYRVAISDPKGKQILSHGTHLERQGVSRYVDHLLAQRRAT
jgi:hypothetical protein